MPQIKIGLGLPIMVVAMLWLGWFLTSLFGHPDPLGQAVLFALTYLALVLLHEVGHGVAALALGLQWHTLRLGLVPSVRVSRRSNGEQLVISLAGPSLHIAAAAAVIIATGFTIGPGGASLAAWIALLDGVFNLVVPVRRFDGYRAAQALWACLNDRSAQTFAGTTTDKDDTEEGNKAALETTP